MNTTIGICPICEKHTNNYCLETHRYCHLVCKQKLIENIEKEIREDYLRERRLDRELYERTGNYWLR